ncbi:MAG TPA: TfoX/Sxy family protein [Chitinophaga sp.]|uniref:TfoX/Sxy family protein n=1 Tax=Chitinophaga sp. TaxID=1869181 RepID=UPI002CCED59E|nr:TfoX/Sxy family protein [Chitinophaga sp.]HVI44619.1 TfoX/Sxy family protein [Chitinophaga sp.]
MSDNEKLADRVREFLAASTNKIEEKKMFGGICFMVNGKMCVGVRPERLMVRLDPGKSDDVAEEEGCGQMTMGNKIMKGYFFVNSDMLKTRKQLEYWMTKALAYNKFAKPSKKK